METKTISIEELQAIPCEGGISYIMHEFGHDKNKIMAMLDTIILNAYDYMDSLKLKLSKKMSLSEIKIINDEIEKVEHFIYHYVLILEDMENSIEN